MRRLTLALLLVAGAARAAEDAAPNELPPEEVKPQAKAQGLVVPVSVMGGLRLAGALKLGKIAPDAADNPNGCASVTSSGDACPMGAFDLAIELGALVFDHVYGGLILGGTFFISPSSSTANVASFVFGTELAYMTNPRGTGGFFGLGIAYRATFVTDSNGTANRYESPDVLFTLGIPLRLASYLRLMPRVDVSLGPTSNADAHEIFLLGISAWFNDDVYPKKRR